MIKTVKDINIKDKKVIIRCDFNVPIENNKIIDDSRIKANLKTINYCLKNNCKIILMSHLGRIKEKSDLKKYDLKIVATRLSELLKRKVKFVNETRGKLLENEINNMKNKDIILMQNTRYEDLDGKKESTNNADLARYWAGLGDVFINDAFATLHRSHASNVGIAALLPSSIGFLVENELSHLEELKTPEKPFTVILGGKKVADKIGVIRNLAPKVDYLLIGGGMAFTFLKAEGYEVGKSIVDLDNIEFCREILQKYSSKVVLPVDIRVNQEFSNDGNLCIKDITELSENDIGLDIGDKSVTIFKNILEKSKTIFWNGPLGVYEFDNFKVATDDILKFLVDKKIKTILGGGDIVASLHQAKLENDIYYASTGGGATLEYLEGKILPGLDKI